MKNLLLALCLVIASTISAQNTINGIVKNSEDQSEIIFANVYFPQLEKGTLTNEDGTFSISNIPSGNYKIIISYVGFETLSQTLNTTSSEVFNFNLKPSAIEMEEVIISTPFHKLQSENVMRVERETISDLKSKGAINLSDGITNISGVESISTGLSVGKPVIRGLSSNRVLVYAQGVRLENQQFGDEHGLGLSDSGIESVEVIKGPASLLYGSDALGGVLYLNPELYAKDQTTAADFSTRYFSNTKGYSSNLGFKSSSDQFRFLIRASQSEHSDYETKDYRVTNSRFREQDLKTGLGYQSSKFKTDFRYNLNLSKIGLPEELGVQNTNRTPLEPNQNLTNHILSSKNTWFFNNSRLEANFGYLYNDRKEFEDHHHEEDEEHEEGELTEDEEEDEEEDEAPALHMKLKTFNFDVKYHLPVYGKFETIVGTQGMHQTNNNYGEELLIPDATTKDAGVFAMSHIHFEDYDVQIGARFDHRSIQVNNQFTRSFNSFNGSIGAKTTLFNKVITRLNIASGFRAPNLAELASDGTHEGTNRYEIGNSNLKNEQNIQTDLVLEYKNEHFEIFANGFYNHINNYIFLAPDGSFIDEDPVFNYLQTNAQLYGGEFGVHLHPHPLDWLHLESSFETVTGIQNDTNLPLIPANSFKNTLRVEFKNKTFYDGFAFFRVQNTFAQNNVSNFETSTDGYTLLSAGFGSSFKVLKNDLELNISGTNLTNQLYINHLSRLKTDGIGNIGRNISIGLKYSI
jgi:iron complex outermembrane receptor protein